MLLKWLFTLLAIIWLYQAIRPFFVVEQRPGQPAQRKNDRDDDEGEYIDYEEVK